MRADLELLAVNTAQGRARDVLKKIQEANIGRDTKLFSLVTELNRILSKTQLSENDLGTAYSLVPDIREQIRVESRR